MEADLWDKYSDNITIHSGSPLPKPNLEPSGAPVVGAVALPSEPNRSAFIEIGTMLGFELEDSPLPEELEKINKIYSYMSKYGEPRNTLSRIINEIGDPALGVDMLNHVFKYVTLRQEVNRLMGELDEITDRNNNRQQLDITVIATGDADRQD